MPFAPSPGFEKVQIISTLLCSSSADLLVRSKVSRPVDVFPKVCILISHFLEITVAIAFLVGNCWGRAPARSGPVARVRLAGLLAPHRKVAFSEEGKSVFGQVFHRFCGKPACFRYWRALL